LQYKNLIGESLENAKIFVNENKIDALFVETKDRYNDYDNKRIIRVKQISNSNKLELLYTGFPSFKE